MQDNHSLEQQIVDEQNKYRSALLDSKEFSSLKTIKNNIKKMQRQLFSMQKGSHPPYQSNK